MNIIIVIRTCLKYDGRVLAQLVTLANKYKNSSFKVYVYPNCKTERIKVPLNVIIEYAKLLSLRLPGSPAFLFIKQIHFGISMLIKMSAFKPDIIHVHDEFAILGPFLYKKWFNKNVKLIYDDHELYNLDSNPSVYRRLRKFLEFKMFKLSDRVIMANAYRAKYAKSVIKNLHNKNITVIDNYPFFELKDLTIKIFKKERGIKYALHQGVINENRGKQLLSEVIKYLPADWRIVLLGLQDESFQTFASEQNENASKIVNGGRVPYDQINVVYKNFDASIIFYKTDNLNEKYCAPNRLFQAANAGLPLIVNNNLVLSDFVDSYQIGLTIDKLQNETEKRINQFFGNYNKYLENAKKLEGDFLYEKKVAPKLLDLYDKLNQSV